MRVHTCLPMQFFYQSFKCACEISNAFPGKNIKNEKGEPTSPFFLVFKVKPHLEKFKVFRCPVVFKRYEPFNKGKKISKKLQNQRGSHGVFFGFPPQQAGALIYVQEKIGPNNLVVSQDVTYDEQFKSAVVCTTAPFQRGLPERSIGHNTWVRNYDPKRETAAIGSAAVIDPSIQEEETHNDFPPPFIHFQDNSPPLFSGEIQTDIQAPIDAPSARKRSKDLFWMYLTRAFQAALSEHPISMFLSAPKSFQAILKQPPEMRKLWLKATDSELENIT
eukprot:13332773-Ditylum_brightwellii.AAC.1